MGSVVHPTAAPEYDDTRRSEVVGVTPAQLHAVAWVDGEGRKSMCLTLIFGKDAEDGGPGIFVMADEIQMKEQLKLANSTVKAGVRKWLAANTESTADDVPAGLSDIDLTPAAEAPSDDPLAGILPS